MQIWVEERLIHFCCHTILGKTKEYNDLGNLLLYSLENLRTVSSKENIEK